MSDAKNFLRQFRGFIKLVESISETEDVELAVKNLEQTKVDLEKETAEARYELDQLKEALSASKKKLQEADKKAEDALNKAHVQVNEILLNARDEAINTRIKTRNEHEVELQGFTKQVNDLKNEIQFLEKQKAQLGVDKSNLEAAIDNLKKKFL